ncbi:Meiotic nuclear division protein 1 [Sesamum angolense]|uniref:Meiotic nuclear division protein 1 n=1 Tax=Sesamum angolense TaxID=2727404 RepID=A0AAE2BNB5_9LAMI|nr:Meiotic nuclear division protein 1 [Sesamum angolense]
MKIGIGLVKSKKRGLSLDEKREKMLQIFYESQDFFLLKELEKLGPKKGVITQSVKDVVQSLVDDDLVFKDKIGTSVSKLTRWSMEHVIFLFNSMAMHSMVSFCICLCGICKLIHVLFEFRCAKTSFRKLDSDLESSKKRYTELIDQCNALRKGREESVKKAIEVAYVAAIDGQAKEQLDHLYNEVGITDDFDYLELPAAAPVSSAGDHMLEGKR